MVGAMKRALLGLALVTSCYRDRTDPDTLRQLTALEQRLEAQDRAIADLRTRIGTEIVVLAEMIAELRADLGEATAQLKPGKPAARPARREPDASLTYAVPIGTSPVFGSPNAKVTLVMAMEFDCPYCRRAWDTVDELRKQYGKDLRVVYKPYVVHPRTARLAAHAACAAHKQGKWRAMAELIWTKAFEAKGSNPDAFSPDNMAALARQAKLDLPRYERDVAGACVAEVRDEQASMQKLGVAATPSFFINGRYLAGAKLIAEFTALIDEERAKATAAIKRGVKADQYYEQEIVGKGVPELAPAPSP
jgi:protein-disulfide isomerase